MLFAVFTLPPRFAGLCYAATCTRAITVPWSIPPSGVARESSSPGGPLSYLFPVYAVYAISSLDTGSPLRHRTACNAVGTHQGVAGLAPRPFTLGEETGSHHGHGHVHRTRMLICMHKWGSSLHRMLFMLFMQLACLTLVPP